MNYVPQLGFLLVTLPKIRLKSARLQVRCVLETWSNLSQFYITVHFKVEYSTCCVLPFVVVPSRVPAERGKRHRD